MGYVESNLGKDEQILARVTHSKAAFFGDVIVAIIIIAVTIAIYYALGAFGAWLGRLSGSYDIMEIIQVALQVVALLIGIPITLWVLISGALDIKFNQLVVTNKRLLGRKGMISKTVIDLPLTKIDNIQVKNGIFGAMFHYGSLEIISAGTQRVVGGNTVSGLTYDHVKNTEEFRRAVLDAIDKAKEEEREAQAKAQAEAMRRAQEQLLSEAKS